MKQCFKCQEVKPLSDFYSHPQMADGHLNKCIACVKSYIAERLKEKMKDPEWAEKEMERHRIKQQRRREQGKDRKLTPEKKREVARRHAEKYPEKHKARLMVQRAVRSGKLKKLPCEICHSPDSEGHHDDYSKPLDVIWLCPKHHAERHVQLRKQLRAITLALS